MSGVLSQPSFRPGHRLLAAFPLAGLLLACSDPTATTAEKSKGLETARYTQQLQCIAQVREGSVSCAPVLPSGASLARGVRGSLLRPIIVGGQGIFVQLTSTNVNYNTGTEEFSFDVTIENLVPQPIAVQEDGDADPNGVRVFFSEQPVATSLTDPLGSAAISINNADGTGTFTASMQPYYQYVSELDGGILEFEEVSAAKTWTFLVNPNVETFTFTVFVDAPVQYPNGYVSDFPRVLTLDPNETFPLTLVVRDAVGRALNGETIEYQSDNTGIVTAGSDGMLTAGSSNGYATISASSGIRPGNMTTAVSVCQSTVVTTNANVPAAISSSDCFSSFGSTSYMPSTSYYSDLYRLSLTAGQTVVIEMDSGNNLNTFLIVADRLGNVVGVNDDDDEGTLGVGSRLVITAATTGIYVIEASTFNSLDQGDYTLRVTLQP